MRRMINNAIHGAGATFCAAGFLFALKAAGQADLGGGMETIVRYAACGMVAIIGGMLLKWWRV